MGSEKLENLGRYLVIFWKRYEIGPGLVWNVNRKSYPSNPCQFRWPWPWNSGRGQPSFFSGGFRCVCSYRFVDHQRSIRHGIPTREGACLLEVRHAPVPKGMAQCAPISGVPHTLFYTPFDVEQPNSATYRDGRVLGGHPCLCTVMWSETVGLRTRLVWDQNIGLGLGLGLAHFGLGLSLAVLVLFCETRSCYARRHNDLEGHSNF